MRYLKKMALPILLGSSLVFASVTFAHEGKRDARYGHSSQYAEHKVGFLTEKLGLSESQQQELLSLFQNKQGGVKKLMREAKKSMEALDPRAADYNEQVAVLAEQHAQQVKAAFTQRAEFKAGMYRVLTDEQIQQLEEMKENKKDRRHNYGRKYF